jgi:hypothetical protein
MKTITAYEFKDLKKEIQKAVYFHFVNDIVEAEIEFLTADLNNGIIEEADFYNRMGCSKYYAESTPWFLPACFYQHNTSWVNTTAKESLAEALFDVYGKVIGHK